MRCLRAILATVLVLACGGTWGLSAPARAVFCARDGGRVQFAGPLDRCCDWAGQEQHAGPHPAAHPAAPVPAPNWDAEACECCLDLSAAPDAGRPAPRQHAGADTLGHSVTPAAGPAGPSAAPPDAVPWRPDASPPPGAASAVAHLDSIVLHC